MMVEYTKVIAYSGFLEIYQYEKRPTSPGGVRGAVAPRSGGAIDTDGGEPVDGQAQQAKVRSRQSIRRAVSDFKRLVLANLGESEKPVFASLTYKENMQDLGRARADFNAFARAMRAQFGAHIRYVAVVEQQRRGAFHYHALVWGIPPEVVAGERGSRLVAGLWGQGFVDLVQTDGHPAIAGYMAKYFVKQFDNVLLSGRKAYISSQNIVRPVIDKGAFLSMYLSTDKDFRVLQDREYMTPYMGRGRYRLLDQVHLEFYGQPQGDVGG